MHRSKICLCPPHHLVENLHTSPALSYQPVVFALQQHEQVMKGNQEDVTFLENISVWGIVDLHVNVLVELLSDCAHPFSWGWCLPPASKSGPDRKAMCHGSLDFASLHHHAVLLAHLYRSSYTHHCSFPGPCYTLNCLKVIMSTFPPCPGIT